MDNVAEAGRAHGCARETHTVRTTPERQKPTRGSTWRGCGDTQSDGVDVACNALQQTVVDADLEVQRWMRAAGRRRYPLQNADRAERPDGQAVEQPPLILCRVDLGTTISVGRINVRVTVQLHRADHCSEMPARGWPAGFSVAMGRDGFAAFHWNRRMVRGSGPRMGSDMDELLSLSLPTTWVVIPADAGRQYETQVVSGAHFDNGASSPT